MPRERRRFINPGRRMALRLAGRELLRLIGRTKFVPNPQSPDGQPCWEWQGYADKNGYGRVKIRGRSEWLNRVSYAALRRTIPAGREIDHHCHNPRCWNPDHLRCKSKPANSAEGGRYGQRKRREAAGVDSATAAAAAIGGSGSTNPADDVPF